MSRISAEWPGGQVKRSPDRRAFGVTVKRRGEASLQLHYDPPVNGISASAAHIFLWITGDWGGDLKCTSFEGRRIAVFGLSSATSLDLDTACRGRVDSFANATKDWTGSFTAILWDEDEVRILPCLAGAQPLFYRQTRECLIICSSLQTLTELLRANSQAVEPSADWLRSFIQHAGPSPQIEASAIEDVAVLIPGHEYVASTSHLLSLPRPHVPRTSGVRFVEGAQKLRARVESSIALRSTKGQIACDLSGGVDSSIVTSVAAKSCAPPVIAITWTAPTAGEHGDLVFARQVAEKFDSVQHEVLLMSDTELPYRGLLEHSLPSDEPAFGRLHHGRTRAYADFAREHGIAQFLTGEGGDVIFAVTPNELARSQKLRRIVTLVRNAQAWATLRGYSLTAVLLEVLRSSASSTWRNGRNSFHSASALFNQSDTPEWLTCGEINTIPDHQFAGWHEVWATNRMEHSDGQLAASVGHCHENPLLDPDVVQAAFEVRPEERYSPVLGKKLAIHSFADLLPLAIQERKTKAVFSADRHAGALRNRTDLLELFRNSRLSALGVINDGHVRDSVEDLCSGLPVPLAALEATIAAEAWLRQDWLSV